MLRTERRIGRASSWNRRSPSPSRSRWRPRLLRNRFIGAPNWFPNRFQTIQAPCLIRTRDRILTRVNLRRWPPLSPSKVSSGICICMRIRIAVRTSTYLCMREWNCGLPFFGGCDQIRWRLYGMCSGDGESRWGKLQRRLRISPETRGSTVSFSIFRLLLLLLLFHFLVDLRLYASNFSFLVTVISNSQRD